MLCVSLASRVWLKHHNMTRWLRSQLIHVKRLLDPLCKLPIEVFIQHYITVSTLPTYSPSCSLTSPFPFLDQSSTASPLQLPAWQQPCMDALRLSVYVCLCQGPQQRLCNRERRGRDTNQAELRWDSMNTAGPFQRQSGSNRLGGWAASHSL